jgi:hypothetical protein
VNTILVFCSGVLTGLVIALGLACLVKHRVQTNVMGELAAKSGVQPMPGETLEAFSERSAVARAERELEAEWGVPRLNGESWDAYSARVAMREVEAKRLRRSASILTVVGPRGQA